MAVERLKRQPSVWVIEDHGRPLFAWAWKKRAEEFLAHFTWVERTKDKITGPHEYRRVQKPRHSKRRK